MDSEGVIRAHGSSDKGAIAQLFSRQLVKGVTLLVSLASCNVVVRMERLIDDVDKRLQMYQVHGPTLETTKRTMHSRQEAFLYVSLTL
ncbi:unnamed protein product [Protopolystoma xenopodis]|uniref:Uncharacterized protein n=1 Tax=Protopolystoma xenopodis TaxID=117903 RepID=A0A3S5AN78_9PLAT|nr:unnamed protein product [Protopolystoma xenopodis]